MSDIRALVEGITKYMVWEEDQRTLLAEHKVGDGADALMNTLYGCMRIKKLVGGCKAPILYDAAKEIKRLREENERLKKLAGPIPNATVKITDCKTSY